MTKTLTFFTVGASFALAGCGTVEKESSAWRSEFGEFRTNMVDAVDKMALAIPGERADRIIWESHSLDPKTREHARAVGKALLGIDVDELTNYVCSVWFDLGPNGTNMAQAFPARAPTLTEVQNYIGNYRFRPVQITSVLQPPPAEDQIKSAVERKISDAIELLAGGYKIETNPPVNPHPFSSSNPEGHTVTLHWPNNALTPGFSETAYDARTMANAKADAEKQGKKALEQRKKAVSALTAAVVEAYESNSTRTLGRAQKVIPWNILGPEPYLIVMIRKSDVEANKDHLHVEASVHLKGDTEKRWKNLDVFRLEYADFAANPPVFHPTKGEYLWAPANVTDYYSIDPEILKQTDELHKRLQEIKAGDKGVSRTH